jgi:hypothetical protein
VPIRVFEGSGTEVTAPFAISGCTGTAWAPLAIVVGTPASGLR